MPRSTLANLEAGGANPTLAVMAALSAALGLSLEELLAAPSARCQLFPHGSLPIRSAPGARSRCTSSCPTRSRPWRSTGSSSSPARAWWGCPTSRGPRNT
ncbi:MAG: helix-turn-helix transcriptional regulator [Planctomycetota bacterium]